MIALALMLGGGVLGIYGALSISQNPVERKADGFLPLVAGCGIVFIGYVLSVLT